jgi:antitoxin component YwqK of YwqJK toxin-antitoxin module
MKYVQEQEHKLILSFADYDKEGILHYSPYNFTVNICNNSGLKTFRTIVDEYDSMITFYETGTDPKQMRRKEEQLHHKSLKVGNNNCWFSNGQLASQFRYNDQGKLDGLTTVYHLNGARKQSHPYVNGNKHGLCQEWDYNGQLKKQSNYENGTKYGLEMTWYDDGGGLSIVSVFTATVN